MNLCLSRKSFIPALIAVLVFCLVVLEILSSHAWDPRSLILQRNEDVPLQQGWGIGYDAQWYYRIALDPLGAYSSLDQPAYRYQRILYPLLARGLSLGQPELVPWAMLVINLVAAGVICQVLGELLRERGASPWFALAFVFSLGFLLTLRMDLLEPLAFALALSGWLAYERKQPRLAMVLFALAGSAKEVALVFPLGLAVWEGLSGKHRQAAALALAGLGPYALWALFLRAWLGVTAVQVAQSTPLWIPFYGVRYIENPASRVVVGMWVLGPAAGAGLAAAWEAVVAFLSQHYGVVADSNRRTEMSIGRDAILVLAQVALIAAMPAPTWADPLAILRVGLGLLATVLVWLAAAHPRLLPYAAALWLPSGIVLFLVPGLL